MLKSVTVINHLGESLKIDMRRPETSGFYIKKIEGLGPVKANINIAERTTIDGGQYNSAHANSRNIVLTLGFLFAHDIESVRHKSYKYFPLKRRITLIIETDTRTCETYGYVESNEPNIFDKEESTVISVVCPDSYFYSSGAGSKTVTRFSSIESLFEFPFSCEGDVPDTPVEPDITYNWLFEDAYLTTTPNPDLPAPTFGATYGIFIDGKHVFSAGCDSEDWWTFGTSDYQYCFVYEPSGWYFHPVESTVQNGIVSICILTDNPDLPDIPEATGSLTFGDDGVARLSEDDVNGRIGTACEIFYRLYKEGYDRELACSMGYVEWEYDFSSQIAYGGVGNYYVTCTVYNADYSMTEEYVSNAVMFHTVATYNLRRTVDQNDDQNDDGIYFGDIEIATSRSILYTGEAPIGVTIYIHAIGTVSNLTIYNETTRESMKIDTSRLKTMTGYEIIAGDDITICTTKGEKSIQLLRNGTYYNILNCLDKRADWFQLSNGDNVFVYMTDSGDTNLEFRVENKTAYEGV